MDQIKIFYINLSFFIKDNITHITFFLESFTTAAVLTAVLMLTKSEWIGGVKVLLAFIATMGSCYIFSGLFEYYFTDFYHSVHTFSVASSGALGFMGLIWAIERDVFFQVFEIVKEVKIGKIKNNKDNKDNNSINNK